MNDGNALQEKVNSAVRQALSDGEALQCTRVWEAWLYNTMTDEDFTDASDGPLADEIAAAVLPIIRAEVAKARAETLREAAERFFYDGDRVQTMHGYALLHHAADEHEAEQNDA